MANAMDNLAANGVDDRVDLVTGDMTALPFGDGSFDLVTASLAIHNVHPDEKRRSAVQEALRVVRPGGRLVLVDISAGRLYAETLTALGAEGVTRRGLGPRLWWTGPWMPTSLVTATRPR